MRDQPKTCSFSTDMSWSWISSRPHLCAALPGTMLMMRIALRKERRRRRKKGPGGGEGGVGVSVERWVVFVNGYVRAIAYTPRRATNTTHTNQVRARALSRPHACVYAPQGNQPRVLLHTRAACSRCTHARTSTRGRAHAERCQKGKTHPSAGLCWKKRPTPSLSGPDSSSPLQEPTSISDGAREGVGA